MKITLSKSQWEFIGKKAGWINKKAFIDFQFGKEINLDEAARLSDNALNNAYHYGLSAPGSFGYEANKGSAKAAIAIIRMGVEDIEQIADAIHGGWANVAKSFDDPIYQTKPQKKEARLKLAETPYENLPEEEKEKDRVVAKTLLEYVESVNASESKPDIEQEKI